MAMKTAVLALLLTIGTAGIIAGITLIYLPAALIVAGMLCVLGGMTLVDLSDGDR